MCTGSAHQQRSRIHADGEHHMPDNVLQPRHGRVGRLVAGDPDAHARLQDEPASTDRDQADHQRREEGRRVCPLHAPDQQQDCGENDADQRNAWSSRCFSSSAHLGRIADAVA
jgi:hypothetical protein